MVTFRNNNNRRNNFRRGERNFKSNNDRGKFGTNFSNNENFQRKIPGRNNHNASKLIDKYNKQAKHFGIDIVSKRGSIISSVSDGVVVASDWTKETGFVIAVQHSGGFLSFYKHNSILLSDVGDYVKKGDPIAVIGNSGELTSGPHLHFELWKNGESVDPENYISF